jgi:hypothetical protein
VGNVVPIDNEYLLVIDFINLEAHRDKMCMRVFIVEVPIRG